MSEEDKKDELEESIEEGELETLYDENGEQIVDEEKINEEMKKAEYHWAAIIPVIVIAVLLVACIIALVIVNTGE